MAGLNVSCGYFFAVVALCEVVRMVSRRLLPPWVYSTLLVELAACFQLGACWLELRMLVMIGPWGGGFGMDVVLTLFFILFLIHEATFDGAQANPLITWQELLRSNSPLGATTLRILSQFGGTQLASVVARVYWSWELTEFHLIQNLMAIDCSSTIQTSVSHGALVEAVCTFLFHLVVMKFEGAAFGCRILSKALTITALVYIVVPWIETKFSKGNIPVRLLDCSVGYRQRGHCNPAQCYPSEGAGPYTTALFNPALAFSVTFHCSGNTLSEYMIVYWFSPLIATISAVFLFNGNIPLLFSKNLLYSQRTKYKIPKGKTTLGPEENKTANRQQARKRDPWKKGSEMVTETENDK